MRLQKKYCGALAAWLKSEAEMAGKRTADYNRLSVSTVIIVATISSILY